MPPSQLAHAPPRHLVLAECVLWHTRKAGQTQSQPTHQWPTCRYNISNFDLPYLIDRAAALKLTKFPYWGRLKNKCASLLCLCLTYVSAAMLGRW